MKKKWLVYIRTKQKKKNMRKFNNTSNCVVLWGIS